MSVETSAASASPAARAGEDRLVRIALGLTVGLLALRLLAIGNFGLFLDEAYYWVWSQHPAVSYYDHPPMVAFFIRLSTALFGEGTFGVRALGALSVAADAALIYAITLTLFASRRIAAWAAIFFNVSILVALSVIIVPDQPLMLFWLAALYGLARIARGAPPAWWLFVGAMVGLAGLSKYTTLFSGLGIVLWLILVPSQQRWLRTPWPYLGGAIAALIFLPVLIWNAQHDWSSFVLQLGRAGFGFPTVHPESFLAFLGMAMLVISPPIFVLALAGLVTSIRGRQWLLDPGRALVILTAVPLPLYLAWHSLRENIGPHWLSPLVAAAAILAALGIDEGGGWWRKLLAFCKRAAAPFGLVITAILVFLLVESFLPLGASIDLTARFRGWPQFAADADRIRRENGAAYFVVGDYGMAGWLSYNLHGAVPVFEVGEWERWTELLPANSGLAHQPALYVGRWGVVTDQATAATYFASVTRVEDVSRPIRDARVETVPAFLVSDPTSAAAPLFAEAE